MVKLRIAEALEGKAIVLVPSGQAGAAFNRLDVNKLVDAFKDDESAKPAPAEPAAAEPEPTP